MRVVGFYHIEIDILKYIVATFPIFCVHIVIKKALMKGFSCFNFFHSRKSKTTTTNRVAAGGYSQSGIVGYFYVKIFGLVTEVDIIAPSNIDTYNPRYGSNIQFGEHIVRNIEPKRIFCGLSRDTDLQNSICAYNPGKTLLLDMNDDRCIYVGTTLYEFSTEDGAEIVDYKSVSELGTFDHPYAYAVDAAGNYYLMDEKVVLVKPNPNLKLLSNPYREYHENADSYIVRGMRGVTTLWNKDMAKDKMDKDKMIKEQANNHRTMLVKNLALKKNY
jgi:hypothetical protein